MISWRHVREVARWEFQRFIKWKQQLVGMLVTIVIAGGFMLVARIANRGDDNVREIAVIGAELLPLPDSALSFRFTPFPATARDSLRALVRERTLAGVLVIRDVDHATLIAATGGPWTAQLRTILTSARQAHVTQRAGLDAAVVTRIMTPPQLEIDYETQRGRGRGQRVTVMIVLGLMLFAVFIGMSYIFASITGEKQIRVTEQVVSAIPAQAWIDGKILGLIAVSLIGMLAQVVAFALVYVLMRTLLDGPSIALPDSLGDPLIIGLVLLFALLGLCFWFSFLGAVAAMIDDPHSSTRGSLLFVPMLASTVAFMILNNAESTLARVLSLFPPTAPSVMPARLLISDVPPLEIVLSIVLLAAGVFALRIAAGRVFRLAMLMYGKEPSWSEVRHWITRT